MAEAGPLSEPPSPAAPGSGGGGSVATGAGEARGRKKGGVRTPLAHRCRPPARGIGCSPLQGMRCCLLYGTEQRRRSGQGMKAVVNASRVPHPPNAVAPAPAAAPTPAPAPAPPAAAAPAAQAAPPTPAPEEPKPAEQPPAGLAAAAGAAGLAPAAGAPGVAGSNGAAGAPPAPPQAAAVLAAAAAQGGALEAALGGGGGAPKVGGFRAWGCRRDVCSVLRPLGCWLWGRWLRTRLPLVCTCSCRAKHGAVRGRLQ